MCLAEIKLLYDNMQSVNGAPTFWQQHLIFNKLQHESKVMQWINLEVNSKLTPKLQSLTVKAHQNLY